MGDNGNKEQTPQVKTAEYFWRRHTALLELVDLIPEERLRRKLKTKILDVAHEVMEDKQEKLKEE